MARAKITKRVVDILVPKSARYIVYDTELKGFGGRVSSGGIASYMVEYRPHGGGRNVTKKRMMIAHVGELTPEQARDQARDRLAEVRHGHDPLADRQTKRRELTLEGLIEQWDIENPPGRRTGKPMKPRTKANTLARLRHHVMPRRDERAGGRSVMLPRWRQPIPRWLRLGRDEAWAGWSGDAEG